MSLKDTILFAMKRSNGAVIPLIDDMRDAPFVQPTQNGGNHPLWILGHLTCGGRSGAEGVVWRGESVGGVDAHSSASARPSSRTRASIRHSTKSERDTKRCGGPTVELFESFTEADLDKPTKWQPPRLEKVMPTYGLTFLTLSLHKMSHRGQLADARRAAGRKPLFM